MIDLTPTQWNYVLSGAVAVLSLGLVVACSLLDRALNELADLRERTRHMFGLRPFSGTKESIVDGIRRLVPVHVVLDLRMEKSSALNPGQLRIVITEPMGKPEPEDFDRLHLIRGRK